MNLASMTTTLNKIGNAALRTLEYHAPKILLGASIICGVGATVTACKATLKLPETMKEINAVSYTHLTLPTILLV